MVSAAPLDILLFGQLDVRIDGRPMPRLRTRKGYWLLALLAMNHDRPVARDWLAGTLWPDTAENHALYSLRRSLTDLRRALGTQDYRLRSPTARTLQIDLNGADCDLLAFDAAIKQCDGARDIQPLQRAIELYRGPLLEGCAEEWAINDRAAREQAYIAALRALAEHAGAHVDPAASARYLRQAIAADPYQESLHQALLQALASAGDYAAVTQAYRNLRLQLRNDLHAEPSAATQQLFNRIRAEGRSVAGRGGHTPATQEKSPRSNLPNPLTDLIGRGEEASDVIDCLDRARLVTLTGSGGVGKTRLAIRVARELADDFADGAWFVDLAPVSDPRFIPQSVAAAMGVAEEQGRPLTETLERNLADSQALIILDNCEHLVESCATLAERLLRGCPGLRILATSRQPLGLQGERTYRVPSLSLPEPGDPLTPDDLARFDAVALFIERACASHAQFATTDANAPTIVRICRLLDGIPLAIELAAARVRVLSVNQIATRLDEGFRLLAGGNRDVLPRHQTLQATIEWSFALLSDAEKTLMRRLAVFSGGFTLDAAEKVCSDDTRGMPESSSALAEDEMLDLLTQLVDKSLVGVQDEPAGSRRFRLLETVAQFGRERLADAAELDKMRDRHRDYFLALSEEAEPHLRGSLEIEWLRRLDAEHDNIRAALTWSESGDARLRIASALANYWNSRCYFTEGRSWIDGALQQSEGVSTQVLARGNMAAASVTHYGDYRSAMGYYENAVRLAHACGDRKLIARARFGQSILYADQGDYETAQRLCSESISIASDIGDGVTEANGLLMLGDFCFDRRELSPAREYAEEALACFRQLRLPSFVASAQSLIGRILTHAGEYGPARGFLNEGLYARREAGHKYGVLDSLYHLGVLATCEGSYKEARLTLSESLRLAGRSKARYQITMIVSAMARLSVLEQQFVRGARLFGVVDGLHAEMGTAPTPIERYLNEPAIDSANCALGETRYDRERAAGRSMMIDDAIAFALDTGSEPGMTLGESEELLESR